MNRYSSYLLSCIVILAVVHDCQAATFTPLGDLPQGLFRSGASGISGDGMTVVGGGAVLDVVSVEATQWTTSGVISTLRDDVAEDGFNRSASAASHTGGVIVGTKRKRFDTSSDIQEAFRWTNNEGIVNLGMLPGDIRTSASDVSGNGEIIVGTSTDAIGSSRAFRWTNAAGMVSLGTLPSNNTAISSAFSISADGSIIVGTSSSGDSQEAFRWTEESGMVGLGDLPGGSVESGAEGISSDGSVIVGNSRSELSQGGLEAFRWTAEGGMQGLGFLNPSDVSSNAALTSADGRLVFGFALRLLNNQIDSSYFVWDPLNGMRDFVQVLENEFGLGGELAGWTDFKARDISDDGLSIVGSGINPDGNREAWLVKLDQQIGIPEPGTAAMAFVAALCGMGRIRPGRSRSW